VFYRWTDWLIDWSRYRWSLVSQPHLMLVLYEIHTSLPYFCLCFLQPWITAALIWAMLFYNMEPCTVAVQQLNILLCVCCWSRRQHQKTVLLRPLLTTVGRVDPVHRTNVRLIRSLGDTVLSRSKRTEQRTVCAQDLPMFCHLNTVVSSCQVAWKLTMAYWAMCGH